MPTMRALVVGGGGSGPASSGGGGGGGFQDTSGIAVVAGDYAITVGAGGSSSNGGDSSFGSLLVSLGGGRGGGFPGGGNGESGQVGGSGGGGEGCGSGYNPGTGGAGTPGQGNAGGRGDEASSSTGGGGSGGGGGAGGVGSNGDSSGSISPASGGAGLSSNITGSSVTYAAGGRGSTSGETGTANTGNGGGGANGGSGIVVIRYTTADYPRCTGGTITTSGSDTIHTFTSNGTFSVGGVSTQDVTDIDFNTATGNGTTTPAIGVTVTERGVCWSTSTNPTITDNTAVSAGTSGAFTAPMTGLTSNTLYYVRAYMTNSLGETNYGEQVSFTTTSIEPDSLYKDIDAVEGLTYAVYLYVGGTTGSVTVKLGSTGYSEVVAAGAGAVEVIGEYGGLRGLIIEMSADFNGYIDDVYWVLVFDESEVIDWNLDELVSIIPINSSVFFKRIEGDDFNRFRIVRYLDVKFKDLNAYVTVLIKKEANETVSEKTKQFIVDNSTGETIPFINKKISMLNKNQAMVIGFSNNRLDETFTVCQFIVKGFEGPTRLFDGGKIINVV